MCGEYLRINNNTLLSFVVFLPVFLSLLGNFYPCLNKQMNKSTYFNSSIKWKWKEVNDPYTCAKPCTRH